MQKNLYDLLPRDGNFSGDALLGRFLEYVDSQRLTLYPAQEAAILSLFEEKNVILNTPTGSGKSLVAQALHFKALAVGKRSVYTCPIKALVNEKWMALCREFGPQNVGLSTGDATVNHDAPILCCTAEILANMALAEGEALDVAHVVMDEFHYYADRERGVAWQVPLLILKKARFLLMSATLGDTAFFEDVLTQLNGRETVTIKSTDRPVPLAFSYAESPVALTLEKLVQEGKAPVYVVHFTQADAAESAQDFTSLNVASREEKHAIATHLEGVKFNTPYGPELRRWLRQGIGLHHAGLLPKYRILVEQLAQKGLLKVICGTDTLGVGINVPIRTVLFTKLCKYNGEKTAILSARDFHQIAGRAGRKGFDDVGWVVAQAPEHYIENKKLEAKAAAGGKKFTKRQPPERNFVNWDEKTFTRLIGAQPERLTSRFQVSHGMLLNVLSRKSDGCHAMRQLIRDCHDSDKAKGMHRKRAWQLFRSLLDRDIIQWRDQPSPGEAKVRVNVSLQEDFSMHYTLSLFLLDTLSRLDAASPDYPLDVLSLVEAILEDPDVILRRQLDKLKGQKVAEMKMAGVEYEARMAELEKLEYPKPLRDFIYDAFNDFSRIHPWVGQEAIRPKSILREMMENYRSFGDYVRQYEIQRSEGLLLRHLNSVYKVLAQTVPDGAKTEDVRAMEIYLGAMLRQVDSSLLDEWEKMRNPTHQPKDTQELRPPGAEEAQRDITRDRKAFVAALRHGLFALLRSLDKGAFDEAATLAAQWTFTDADNPWTAEAFAADYEPYKQSHGPLRLDAEGRNLRHTYVTETEGGLTVQQMLVDEEGINDWVLECFVDVTASRRESRPVMQVVRLETFR